VDQETKLEPAKQGSREECQKADSGSGGFNTYDWRQERHPAYEILTIQSPAYISMAAN